MITSAALGFPCSEKADCQKIRNADCSENICSCRWDTIKINSTFCASRLDGLCATDEDCATKNSICIHDRCKCKLDVLRKNSYYCDPRMYHYFQWVNSLRDDKNLNTFSFTSAYLTMPCKINADCNDFIKNSMCSEKKGCQCLKDYVSINETACIILYGAYCSSDEQCLLENSYCIDNACQCKPGYKRLGSKCESSN